MSETAPEETPDKGNQGNKGGAKRGQERVQEVHERNEVRRESATGETDLEVDPADSESSTNT